MVASCTQPLSTRGHLVQEQDVVSLDGKISLARFQRLVKFEYFIYVKFVVQKLRVDLVLIFCCFLL